ncbi:MAG: NHL repeat protein [Planctomycetes bacterium ADurb.Bin126]|nr:MAG: NHL repeat protein [Planctomycetes bacterium ADurb.Bin126]
MRDHRLTWILFLPALWAGACRAETGEADLVLVSTAASPRVAYALDRGGGALEAVVAVDWFRPDVDEGVAVELGLAADREVRLGGTDARVRKADGRTFFAFTVPADKLVAGPAGWDRLRMALAVEWSGGPNGLPRQRESFLQGAALAPHAGLASTDRWQPIHLGEFEKMLADRRLQIAFTLDQPVEGKATVVIEDERGNRVRNLMGGRTMAKGPHRIVWDAADDAGRIQPPGRYRWRALAHPGLRPRYVMSFCDGPGSNHGTFHAAATNGKCLFFGTPVSEGGYQLVQLDPDGRMVRGFNAPHGTGLNRVALAADDKSLYAAYDGSFWGQHVDRSKPNWQAEYKITLLRVDLAAGAFKEYGKSRSAEIRRYSVGPGSPDKRLDRLALAGLALLSGKLYLADAGENAVLVIDPATGAVERTFGLPDPVALAAGRDRLFALSGSKLVELDASKGSLSREIATLPGRPAGLAVATEGRFFVSDAESHTVRVFDSAGKQTAAVGLAGGIKSGPYDPRRLDNPAGLVLSPDGHLWITESGRWTPKRLAAFDIASGNVWKEFFGPTSYGASGAGFDPTDASRWFGQGTLFKLDMTAGTAQPLAILGGKEGRSYRYWRQDGRTFVIACGKATWIQELRSDNTLKPLAMVSSAHQFAYACDWKPPEAFVEAFRRAYPDKKYTRGTSGQPTHGFGMMWVDRSGDGELQADEIEFSTAADNFGGSGWGHDFHDLTLRVAGKVDGKTVLVTLKPDGWHPSGAPRYPALNDAVKAGVPIDLTHCNVESTTDRFGNVIVNSDPVMKAFAPDGRLLWTYPNRWSNVHGSHRAPLPSAGELQGVLFFTGAAPLDERSDVVAMNGNHGRAFFMTSDGLYVDEMFPDVRLMSNPQAGGVGILGGECFGGAFGRDEKSGTCYYQGGGIEYRIYRVEGLDRVARSGGELTVSAEQVTAAERNQVRQAAAAAAPAKATIRYLATPPAIDGKLEDWPGEPAASWNRGERFPVSVRAGHDGKTLYLAWTVRDASPWVNGGKDWQAVFKTGDSVDIQLGTDARANPRRSGPVPGDLRLLVAPFQKENIAVLYRHRLSGASDGVVFQSPWRSEKVDSVRRLASARIAVQRRGDSYQVELAVPLTDLGLPAPLPNGLRGDFGVLYGDAEGTATVYRNYWSNQATALVNDVPGEIMLSPNLWGDLTVEVKE